jgi:DNA-binding MarR family transcriptional regulator
MSRPTVATQQDGGPEITPPSTLLYVIKQVELAVRARLDEIVRPAGLTTVQYTALTVLERHPDLTSAQLARHSFVTAQTMADMVVMLHERGLVDRHRDPRDRRRLVLTLTGEGRRLLRRYRRPVSEIEAEMLAPLSAHQAEQLRQSLTACRAALVASRGLRDPGPVRNHQEP